MTIKNVTVAGSGVLGSQIAFQTAFKGFSVTVYDINEDAINKAKERIKGLRHMYKHDIAATDEEFEAGWLTDSSELTMVLIIHVASRRRFQSPFGRQGLHQMRVTFQK